MIPPYEKKMVVPKTIPGYEKTTMTPRDICDLMNSMLDALQGFGCQDFDYFQGKVAHAERVLMPTVHFMWMDPFASCGVNVRTAKERATEKVEDVTCEACKAERGPYRIWAKRSIELHQATFSKYRR